MSPGDESELDQKMDQTTHQMVTLILNTMIDVLKRLKERNEDQMRYQTTVTYI